MQVKVADSQEQPVRGRRPSDVAEEFPLVTVIMPVYNAGVYLRPAVESVLTQTYRNVELIVIDDGSTDDCLSTIADITDARVRRVQQNNAGKPVAMNRGLEMARGAFYALQDADDISHPKRIECQLACMHANPSVAAVFCGHEIILADKIVAPRFRSKSIQDCARDIALGHMPAHDPTAMYRLAMVSDVRYAEDLPIVEGHDYILRVGERFPVVVLGDCLYQYRIHPESVTKKDPARRNRLSLAVTTRMYERRGYKGGPPTEVESPSRGRASDADNDLVSHFTMSVADQVLAGDRLGALRTGVACWGLNRLNAYYVKPLVYALTPSRVMKAYRLSRERELTQHYRDLLNRVGQPDSEPK